MAMRAPSGVIPPRCVSTKVWLTMHTGTLSARSLPKMMLGEDEWTAIPDTPEGSIPAQATLEVVAINGAMAVVRQVSTGNED